jgi:hypothetical protein
MAITALKKKIAGGAAALVLGTSLVAMAPNEASAQWRRHGGGWRGPGIAAGVVGGLALGALATGAYNNGYYGGPGYYAAPVYGGDCYLTRERVWNGYTWVNRRVRVCD